MAQVASLDAARVSDIARQIRGAVTPFLGANSAKDEAAEALTKAKTAEGSMREGIILTLANLSQAGQWSEREVAAAAGQAAKMSNNDSEKALATFIGETKRAMHPNVRSHAHALSDLRTLCWDDETAQLALDKQGPKPLRKAFARSYHLLLALYGEVAEGNRMFGTREDVLAFAAERDPDLKLKTIISRLKSVRETLEGIYYDWPVDDISLAAQTIASVDEAMLKAARGVSDIVKLPVRPTTVVPTPATVVAESVVIPTTPEQSFVDEYLTA